MTRPIEIKPREGEQKAALFADWIIGDEFPALTFTITLARFASGRMLSKWRNATSSFSSVGSAR